VSFFGELRRRNVFKVGGAYVVVASLLILVAGIVFPTATLLPAWAVTFVMVVLVLGFPVAVVLAWAYEITPEGIKRTRRVRNSPARSRPVQNLHSRSIRRR